MASGISGSEEWKRSGSLPFAAALGYATSVIHVYSIGPFIQPLQNEFAWSRAEVTGGLALSSIISAIFCIPVGLLVDRIGPRRVALAGILLITGAYALLGTATGSASNWMLLWALIALATIGVQTTVWTAAVTSRFEASRGMALAVTLSGASIGATIFPLIGTWLIGTSGWRMAFFLMGGLWALLVFPMIFLCFRGARDLKLPKVSEGGRGAEQAPPLVGLSYAQGLKKPALYQLLLASGLFTFTAVGTLVHFVPILTGAGADPLKAASIASLIGIFSIVGRLGTGFLLDRAPGHYVGAIACIFPILSAALLLYGGGSSLTQSAAAVALGLTLGAEVDVIAYLASRHFGLKSFGALYGTLVMALALGTAFGPLAAGAMFDKFGGYTQFLWLTSSLMLLSAISLASLGRPPATLSSGGAHAGGH